MTLSDDYAQGDRRLRALYNVRRIAQQDILSKWKETGPPSRQNSEN